MNGPFREGDLYRFDMAYEWMSPYSGERTVKHFCMDAQDEAAALYEAEYVLNMDIVKRAGATGKLWRVDGGQDVLVAELGPIDFSGSFDCPVVRP
ncbi:MAG TPA: hypothetical protein VFM12_06395 [Gemmatimonadales bacterium]|nr:hypothetical protein [Gemmatimonadales bacterium]